MTQPVSLVSDIVVAVSDERQREGAAEEQPLPLFVLIRG